MVRVKTADNLCYEFNLETSSYTINNINFSSLNEKLNTKITSLDFINDVKKGENFSNAIYLHDINKNAHSEKFKAIKEEIDKKADTEILSTVAKTGDYNDLKNTPSIPDINTKIDKTGDTISGDIIITSNNNLPLSIINNNTDTAFILKNENDNTSTLPPEIQLRSFRVLNSDDTILGDTRFIHRTNGNVDANLIVRNYYLGEKAEASIGVSISSTGTASFTCSESIKHQITNWAFPSERFITYSLGANEEQYIAPDFGWFALNKICENGTQISLMNITNGFQSRSCASLTSALTVILPVRKNDLIKVLYNSTGNTNYFRFYYTNGNI